VNRVNSGWHDETPDPSDWEQWLARHTPAWLLFARQQARCEADAQDLVQEAIVECWRRNANQAPPPALVFATLRRRAIDLARSQDRRVGREAVVGLEAAHSWFDSAVEDRERNRLIEEAMRALPEIHREVITLKLWGGLTFAEIAEALDIPANTAASRYRYGLEELRGRAKEIFV
jgi:RNA polymerase sigma-70 factor, ECF subfamily